MPRTKYGKCLSRRLQGRSMRTKKAKRRAFRSAVRACNKFRR